MMTGRTYDADEGQQLGLSHYVVENGKGFEKGLELTRRIATNTALTNYALIHALPRIARADTDSGYMLEALMSSIASGDAEAQSRLSAFLEKRGPKASRS
jgi:(methylthio)acryloyl-CoA hydratase